MDYDPERFKIDMAYRSGVLEGILGVLLIMFHVKHWSREKLAATYGETEAYALLTVKEVYQKLEK